MMRACLPTVFLALSVTALGQPAPPEDTGPEIPAGLAFDVDVAYGTQSAAQRLDILYPDDPAAPARPLIVHIHGGGWYAGGKGGESTLAMMKAFAAAGYVAASIDYRLSDEAPFPAAIEDGRLAVRWLRSQAARYHVDPGHIGVVGASAGGHLSAILAVTGGTSEFAGNGGLEAVSSAVQAAVPVCGPMDLQKPLSLKLGLDNDEAVIRFLGGTPAQKPEEARRASPASYIRPGLPPMFLIHGSEDRRVELVQSTDFAAAVEAAGSPCEVAVVEGGGHGMGIARTPEMAGRIITFFDGHLKPAN